MAGETYVMGCKNPLDRRKSTCKYMNQRAEFSFVKRLKVFPKWQECMERLELDYLESSWTDSSRGSQV